MQSTDQKYSSLFTEVVAFLAYVTLHLAFKHDLSFLKHPQIGI